MTEAGAPEFPEPLAYLWGFFLDCMRGIAPNGMVPPAIGWSDVAAWAAITRVRLEPWEARLIVDLGAMRAAIRAELAATKTNKDEPHGHPLQV